MAQFTNATHNDMNFTHGFCDGNARAALREYQHQYPYQRQSNRWICNGIPQPGKQVHASTSTLPATKAMCSMNEDTLDTVHTNPLTSAHQVSYETGLSLGEVQCTVHEQHNLYSDYNQWIIIFASSSVDGFYTKLYVNLMFCVVYHCLMRKQSQKDG